MPKVEKSWHGSKVDTNQSDRRLKLVRRVEGQDQLV